MTLALLATVAVIFLIYSLAGLSASPVVFANPPSFVEQYAAQRYPSQPSIIDEKVKKTSDFFNNAAMVRNVIVNEEPVDDLMKLFTHPDKAVRVNIALAFGEVNIRLSHDDGTKFDEKRKLFWQKASSYSDDIQNALFEALIVSAQENTRTFIPYTLAWWMEDEKLKAVEVLTWAAQHHPDTWVRNFSTYFVVQYGGSEEHAQVLLASQVHDPVFRIRNQALTQKTRRFKEAVFGKEG